MRTTFTLAVVFLMSFILIGCAGDGGFRTTHWSDQDIARLMAVDDKLIVPGERVGPIFIGMTEAQLYQKLGNPSFSWRTDDGEWIDYEYNNLGLNAKVRTSTHKVTGISSTLYNSNATHYYPYATREGITIGSSELQLQILPWPLSWKKRTSEYPSEAWTLAYSGIFIYTNRGQVVSIEVD